MSIRPRPFKRLAEERDQRDARVGGMIMNAKALVVNSLDYFKLHTTKSLTHMSRLNQGWYNKFVWCKKYQRTFELITALAAK